MVRAGKRNKSTLLMLLGLLCRTVVSWKSGVPLHKQFARDGVVLPTNIRSGVFVTFDVDNLDNKNQGNFSHDEFHGTAISVTNHLSHNNHVVK